MTDQPAGLQKYLSLVSQYENEYKKWEARAQKIVKRYRDDGRGSGENQSSKFNILWSNVETLKPAVYAKMPKADVSRRFADNDPVGRVGALLIERALDFEIEHYPDFRAAMSHSVEDRFLCGRGVAWQRFEPYVRAQDDVQITEDTDPESVPEQIDHECAPTDYVYWRDFGHSVARTWGEVTSVWRWVYMGRKALIDRFGAQVGDKIPLDSQGEKLTRDNKSRPNDTARICELWDKDQHKVVWFTQSYGDIIDERDDPLELEGFFPCPPPLYATTTNDSLIPVPDFILYQDQANDLDILSDRIDGLVKALRVRGVYDASQASLQRLLTEGDNNTLIPVDSWSQFSEKGGLKGVIDILPTLDIAQTLVHAYEAMSQLKEQIYEITGISDILRGATEASETATAQQIKGQYAALRLKSMQEAVALYASDLIRLKAQIICTKFQPETILAYAAAEQLTDADKQLVPQAMQLIKNNPLRTFRIEVSADSLVQLDEQQNKQDRVEFLTALGGFLKEALPVGQQVPEMATAIMETLKFAVAGFKQARSIEGTLDTALEQLKVKAAQAAQAGPAPDPEVMKIQAQAQADQQRAQADAQAKAAQLAADQQADQAKAQTDMAELQMKERLEMASLKAEDEFQRWKVDQETARAIMVARIAANPGADIPVLETERASAERITSELEGHVGEALAKIGEAHQSVQAMHEQTKAMHGEVLNKLQETAAAMTAPKRIIRDGQGRVARVETVHPGTIQ